MTKKVTWSDLQVPPINLWSMPKHGAITTMITATDIKNMMELNIPQPTVDHTLAERGKRYGSFADHAYIAQTLKGMVWGTGGWGRLANDQKQALEVIMDKVARILNGDPDYVDNWHDIQGYAKLVEDRLNENS